MSTHSAEELRRVHIIKPKHARAYRKRHFLSLLLLLALMIYLLAQLVWMLATRYQRQLDARQAATATVSQVSAKQGVTLNSSLGFSLTFDKTLFDVEATEVMPNGEARTFDVTSLATSRRYALAQFTPKLSAASSPKVDASKLTLAVSQLPADFDALRKQFGNLDNIHLVAKADEDKPSSQLNVVQVAETTQLINGVVFLKQVYIETPKTGPKQGMQFSTSQFTLYTTIHNDKVYSLKLAGVITGVTPSNLYNQVIASLKLTQTVSIGPSYEQSQSIASSYSPGPAPSLTNRLLNTQTAQAATLPTGNDARLQIVARYTPAVVRIYHIVCGDLVYLGQSLGNDCDGSVGSGFFVSSEGYIATNGHVVSTTAKDTVANSLQTSPNVIVSMLQIEGYSASEIDSLVAQMKTSPAQVNAIIQAVYNLQDDKLVYKDAKQMYIVALGTDTPDLRSIITTKQPPQDSATIKNAQLSAVDYNSQDLVSGTFTHSDVALLKVNGHNFPVTKLGSLSVLTPGSNLTVIGFPTAADNALTDNTQLKATATDGVVSAVRNTNDAKKRIVQSDVKIGHGNSGGPAFDETGRVFGLATYTFASPEAGDGTISYMRDIQDLTDLSRTNNIALNSTSTTQTLWEDGLNDFFNAHYASAIKKFKQVQAVYPAHSLAADYIAIAQTKIRNGEEARSPLTYEIVIGSVVLVLIGLAITITIIIRHHGKYQIYKLTQAFMETTGLDQVLEHTPHTSNHSTS